MKVVADASSDHWSTISIRSPRLLVVLIAMLIVGGLSSYMVIPRMEDPVLSSRAANIATLYPVADAEQVETLVTDPIEKAIRDVEEIKELRSQSRAGFSLISIELRDDVYETGDIWSRIRGKVEDSIASLPADAGRPQFNELSLRAFAWLGALTWVGEGKPNHAILGRFAKDLEDRMRSLAATEDVEQFGGAEEEILVAVNQSRLANTGLSAADVAAAIANNDARNAVGTLRSRQQSLPVELTNQLDSVEAIGHLPIKLDSSAGGNFLVVADVATVDRTIAYPPAEMAQIDGQTAMMVGALVRPRSRLDHWRSKLQVVLDDFEAELPPAIELSTVLDQNNYVEGRLLELLGNLALGSIAVLLVVWLLMGWRNAIMVSVSLPLVSLAVLSAMRFNGTAIHQMSLAGLIIALGLLIDNAIVIVDSVSKHLKAGKSKVDAVAATSRSLFIPLLASTLTTAFAFAPICLMEGPAGEFVGSMAVNVIISVSSSLFISLLIIAPLTAILNRVGDADASSSDAGISPGFLKPVFRRSVLFAIRRPLLTTLFCGGLAAAGVAAMSTLPDQFFPPAGRDQFHVELELPSNASFAELESLTTKISTELSLNPRVEQTVWMLGRSIPPFYYNLVTRRLRERNFAQAIVQLDSKENSSQAIRGIQQTLQRKFPEARFLARQLEQGPPFAAPIEVRFFGPDLDVLRDLGEKTRKLLSEIEDIVHVRAELNDSTPTVRVDVSSEEAQLAGLQPGEIARQLNAQLEGAVGGFVLQETEQIPVRVRVNRDQRQSLEDLNHLNLVFPSATGPKQVPLNAVSTLSLEPTTATVARINSIRMQEVQAFLQAGTLPSTVLAKLKTKLEESDWQVPPRYRMEFGGEASKRGEAVGNLMASVGVLVAAMIATLVLSIGSFRGAMLIGVVALMAIGFGGASLFVFGYPFGFMAIVGIMGLIGIAINDSIVVLTALQNNPQAASGDEEAILEVTMHETRHVLATTLTTICGFLPLIFAGGGFWPPMAIAIAGGVVGCTLLALVFVPSAFGFFARRSVAASPNAAS